MYITKQQSIALALGFLTLFFALGFFLLRRSYSGPSTSAAAGTSASTQASSAPAAGANGDPAQFRLNEFHRVETRDGQKLWEIKAKNGRYFPENNTARIEQGNVWIFRKDGDVVKLEAGSALIHLQGASLAKAEASEGVTVVFNDELTVKTAAATYDKIANTISAPGHVTIVNDRMELSGKGLDVDVESETFRLEQTVETMLKPKNASDENPVN